MATIYPTSVPTKRLAASITAASSTIQVNNILGWDGIALTSADFGTKLYCVLRNDAGTLMEIMELDPSTIASASITILLRGLKFTGDLTTEVTANKLTWVKNETIVELGTDVPQLLKHFVDTVSAQTIAGAKTFSSAPASSVDASLSTELVRKSQLDAAVLGSLSLSPVVEPGTGGAVLTIDQGVYQDASDGKWKLWDADTAATVENVRLGITRGACAGDGSAITDGVTVGGLHVAASAIFTANTKYYASNTAGGFSTSAGTKEVTVGYAHTTTQFSLAPRYDQQLTENQKDLITAIEGGTEFYGASAAGTDTYAITASPAPTAYANGMRFRFKADVANTGAATLNANSLGAITIKKLHDQDLGTGDIEANQIVEVVYNSTGPVFEMVSQTSVSPLADIQKFTADGTWTKPTGAKSVKVVMFGAGGGGGSGARSNVQADATGGSGGGGGAMVIKQFLADALSATEAVVVGVGGTGGALRANGTGNGSGSDGVDGEASTFGTNLLRAAGGIKGLAGNTAAPTGGAGGTSGQGDLYQDGGAGGDGGDGAPSSGASSTALLLSPRGGGGGAGAGVSGTESGAAGGGFTTNYVKAGGAGGVASVGTAGTTTDDDLLIGGVGGGGGACRTNAASYAGGAGGFPGGGGGGGGAEFKNTTEADTGAGAAGADGSVIVISYF